MPILSDSSRRYMQGYLKPEEPEIKPIHRLLAKITDGRWICNSCGISFKEGFG